MKRYTPLCWILQKKPNKLSSGEKVWDVSKNCAYIENGYIALSEVMNHYYYYIIVDSLFYGAKRKL